MSEQLKTLSIIAMQLGFLIIDWRIYARERERSRDCLIKAEHLEWRNSHYWLRKAEFLDQKQSNWLITILVYLPYDCSCANARVNTKTFSTYCQGPRQFASKYSSTTIDRNRLYKQSCLSRYLTRNLKIFRSKL